MVFSSLTIASLVALTLLHVALALPYSAPAVPSTPSNLPPCALCADCGTAARIPLERATGLPFEPFLSQPPHDRHFRAPAGTLHVELLAAAPSSTLLYLFTNQASLGCTTLALSRHARATGPSPADLFLVWPTTQSAGNVCVWTFDDVPAMSFSSVYTWDRCPDGWTDGNRPGQ